uniref:Transcription initiation factor TFIID subunit 2 n=1 Tax=Rhabditophanes sp. KR3021 TaxID=114890 RepID=A0AC35UGS2_9BILA
MDYSNDDIPYRVISQLVFINNVNFQNQSFDFRTELTIAPLKPALAQIELHIGNDVLLPSECEELNGLVTMEGAEVIYIRKNGPKSLSKSGIKDINFMHFQSTQYRKTLGNGITTQKMLITVNRQTKEKIKELRKFSLCIEGRVVKPSNAIHFATMLDGKVVSGAHMYTMRTNHLSSTHHWLPCLDLPNHLSIWRFEITCEKPYIAIASGEKYDVLSNDGKSKNRIFIYEQAIPTSAMNVGFAIGQFQEFEFGDVPKIVCYSLPHLLPYVKHTMENEVRTLEFFEGLLGCKFPFNTYHIIFVDEIYDAFETFSSVTMFRLTSLYHKKIFDNVRETRQYLAMAIAQQYFGCLVNISDWLDIWLIKSLSRFLTTLYVEKYFGNSEYVYQMSKMLQSTCDYEMKSGKMYLRPIKDSEKASMLSQLQSQTQAKLLNSVVFPGSVAADKLDQTKCNDTTLFFDPRCPETCSPLYVETLYKKGHFILRVLQMKLGKDIFFKVIQKVLSMTLAVSEKLDKCGEWEGMCVSTESFFKTVTNVTGQELPSFLEQWVYGGGHAIFHVQYTFNRKRNAVELEVKQEAGGDDGFQMYVGPLNLIIQELDGSFAHTIQIDSKVSKHDLPCHSKGRRQKKKKVPLHTGEEVEMDVSMMMEIESPVLWIRIDPNLQLVRKIKLNQPHYNWQYMLKYERDVLAQCTAIEALDSFLSPETQSLLLEVVQTPNFFFRVRIQAVEMLVKATNYLNSIERIQLTEPSQILLPLKKFFSCNSSIDLPKPNNYSLTSTQLQQYFLIQQLPIAMSRLRSKQGDVDVDVFNFIMNLHKYNDNSLNRYSDDYYRGNLISAMANLTTRNRDTKELWNVEHMNFDVTKILKEVTFAFNMDTMKPSYCRIVGSKCIKTLYKLMCLEHLPLEPDVFKSLCKAGIFIELRKSAMICLIDMAARYRSQPMIPVLDFILTTALETDNLEFQQFIGFTLVSRPPFTVADSGRGGKDYEINTPELMWKLWNMINNEKLNSRFRLYFVDIFYSMYGGGVPPLLQKKSEIMKKDASNIM